MSRPFDEDDARAGGASHLDGNDYILHQAAKARVRFVELWLAGVGGRLRGITLTRAQLDGVLDDGVVVPATLLGVREGDGAPPPRVTLIPDPRTWAVLPTAADDTPVVARLFCEAVEVGGGPYALDSRGVLKKALGRASDRGYTFYAGVVTHHRYLTPAPEAASGDRAAFGLMEADPQGQMMRETALALEQMGVAVNGFYRAGGAGHYGVELAYSDALTLADAVMTCRRVVAEVALGHGREVTSAAHDMVFTLSLSDGGEPAFDGPAEIGAGGLQFAAGIRVAMPAMSLLGRSTTASYARPLEGPLVSTRPAGPGPADGAHLAVAGADGATNPYLMLAALLDAGLSGGSPGATQGGSQSATGAMPATLEAAAEAAQGSRQLQHTLGAPLLAALLQRARS